MEHYIHKTSGEVVRATQFSWDRFDEIQPHLEPTSYFLQDHQFHLKNPTTGLAQRVKKWSWLVWVNEKVFVLPKNVFENNYEHQ